MGLHARPRQAVPVWHGLSRTLHGFRAAGLRRVYLEVTAENTPAVELYRSVGFRVIRTMYKAGADTPAGVA